MKHHTYPSIVITAGPDGRPVFHYQVGSPFQDTLAGVLQFLKHSECLNNAQLAQWLGLAKRTVENYLQGRMPQLSVIFLVQTRLSELRAEQAAFRKGVSSLPMPSPERSESPSRFPSIRPKGDGTPVGWPPKKETTNVPRGTCTSSVGTKGPTAKKKKGVKL